ncbi:MAG: zinc transporter ZupT [Dehalococcoidales bacterium]
MDINVGFALLLTTLAGLSTGIGSLIAFFIRKPNPSTLAVLLGLSAGVMIYISFTELLGTAIADIGFAKANLAFFVGIIFFALIDILVPHSYKEECASDHCLGIENSTKEKSNSMAALKRSGIFIAAGIAIHNFPEGIVTFSAAATGDVTLGVIIAAAVALHNIPEGIAVSVPILVATGSRKKAFGYSFLSGLAEPVGAVIAFLVLMPFLTPEVLSMTLAFVAGIMIYISLDEILPMAHHYGREHLVIIGVVAGMAVMALSLFILG